MKQTDRNNNRNNNPEDERSLNLLIVFQMARVIYIFFYHVKLSCLLEYVKQANISMLHRAMAYIHGEILQEVYLERHLGRTSCPRSTEQAAKTLVIRYPKPSRTSLIRCSAPIHRD